MNGELSIGQELLLDNKFKVFVVSQTNHKMFTKVTSNHYNSWDVMTNRLKIINN